MKTIQIKYRIAVVLLLLQLLASWVAIATYTTKWDPIDVEVFEVRDNGHYLLITLRHEDDYQEYIHDKEGKQ